MPGLQVSGVLTQCLTGLPLLSLLSEVGSVLVTGRLGRWEFESSQATVQILNGIKVCKNARDQDTWAAKTPSQLCKSVAS